MSYPPGVEELMDMGFYDRHGVPIGYERFADLKFREVHTHEERADLVALTECGGHEVSTVWLGWAEGHDAQGHPMIFETAVFSPTGEVIFCVRYATEVQAAAGHVVAVGALRLAFPQLALPPAPTDSAP